MFQEFIMQSDGRCILCVIGVCSLWTYLLLLHRIWSFALCVHEFSELLYRRHEQYQL